MECNNCGSDKARAWRVRFDKDLGKLESCDQCSNISLSSTSVPDVFWNGSGYHPGILGKDNKPVFLSSRREKARIMKEQGIREAGDRHHGQIGTEAMYVPRRTMANENVLKLKKIFQEHDSRRT